MIKGSGGYRGLTGLISIVDAPQADEPGTFALEFKPVTVRTVPVWRDNDTLVAIHRLSYCLLVYAIRPGCCYASLCGSSHRRLLCLCLRVVLEKLHELPQVPHLDLDRFTRCCGFFDEGSVLLRHLVHLHHRLVHLLDAGRLLLTGGSDLVHDIAHFLDCRDNFTKCFARRIG